MIYEDEDARTQRAVNAAARETDDDTDNAADDDSDTTPGDTPPAPASTPMNPAPTGPDLTIFIAANPGQGHYAYRLVDNFTGLSHNAVHVQQEADETALALLAVGAALKSILKKGITRLVAKRYGYATLGAAQVSHKRLTVQLMVSDSDLAQLGGLVTAPANVGILKSMQLTEADRLIWSMVTSQSRRFDVSWGAIAANDLRLDEIEEWSSKALAGAAHTGPMSGLCIREVVFPPLLIRFPGDTRAVQFPRDIAHRLIMKRLATPIGDASTAPDLIVDESTAQDYILAAPRE
jgi:hypothetical protein